MSALAHVATTVCLALAVGEAAPDFEATDSDGQPVKLASLLARGPVVLAFFPRPFTPGCSEEMARLETRASAWRGLGAQVVAVSRSDSAKMGKFKADRRASFPFVGDDGTLVARYGVRAGPLPMSRRVSFVIGRDGKVLAKLEGGAALDMDAVAAALPPPLPGPAAPAPTPTP